MTAYFSNRHVAESARLFSARRYAPAVPMSAPHRPFLLRFTLALLGMLLFVAVVFAGLGWTVRWHPEWLRPALGFDRTFRLGQSYAAFMADLMPDDKDGDGFCDGAELFIGSDPRNPKSIPNFTARCLPDRSVTGYCGERVRLRWVQESGMGNVRWPRGFRAVVRANEPVLLPKDGVGPPTRGPLMVPVSEGGDVEFDAIAERLFRPLVVDFLFATGVGYGGQGRIYFPGWRTPPISASMDGGQSVAVFRAWSEDEDLARILHSVNWMAPPDWSGNYVIEAARDDREGLWQPIGETKSPKTEWTFYRRQAWGLFPGYTGPLKFRVVPVSPTPP